MFRVTVIVASSEQRESGHKKPEAQNMFFDVVMKVLTFIVSVIRVKLPKITRHLLFFVSDDLWMFCLCRTSFIYFFYYF